MFFKELDLNQNKLHHAYLLLGKREDLLVEVLEFIKSLNVSIVGNSDLIKLEYETFKIDDARALKYLAQEKSFTEGRKIFVIAANSFLVEAQNSLLKLIEDPLPGVHFFVITSSEQGLLATLLSRFHVVSFRTKKDSSQDCLFLGMDIPQRLEYIKKFLNESEESISSEGVFDSPRTKALTLLNQIEKSLSDRSFFDYQILEHIFKVRQNLRQPGSAPKTLLESVALAIPKFL